MKSDNFNYTYSAPKQDEIKRIKEKYAPRSEAADKMDQLRRLDRSVSEKATMISMSVGIIGALIMGIGMSFTLVWADRLFIPGIVIGVCGNYRDSPLILKLTGCLSTVS